MIQSDDRSDSPWSTGRLRRRSDVNALPVAQTGHHARARRRRASPSTRRTTSPRLVRPATTGTSRQASLRQPRGMSRKPMPPARKAATATSLAALSTMGGAPPAFSASRARRSAGKRTWIRRLEGELADPREVEPRRRRRHAVRPGQRVGDRRAHVGRAELGQNRAVDIGDQAVDHRLRMDERSRSRPAGRRGGAPRSAPAPCSSSSPNRPRSWRPCPSWDGRPPGPGSRAAISASVERAERAARGGQDDPLDALSACRSRRPGRWRCARESTGSSVAP